ncbi:MAG TPA: hypothetical protein VMY59_08815 [Candidatus Thermoplasmatota archaeon]|nr:hypothetical protein [Candidatus Thermoplasmatota archaeon]
MKKIIKLIEGEYYWVKDNYGDLEVSRYSGNEWNCMGIEYGVEKDKLTPIKHIRKP